MRKNSPHLRILRTKTALLRLCSLVLLPGMVTLPISVSANPSGANVVHGAATFNGLGTGGLTINQTSGAAIINWQDFSIGAGEWTRFVQPGSGSTAINRVVSGNPSEIYGSLSGNGNVMVINPNGIVVGAGGVIDVAGAMTLSTLDASNSDLLSGNSTRFYGSGTAGVTNYGSISAGDVIVLGNFVSNSGSIVADRSIAIGAGGDILVNQTLDGASISVRGSAAGGAEGISNSGDITGGSVDMKAHGNSYALAINNTGTGSIRAKGYSYKGGILSLNAGSSGRVVNTGNLYARQQQTGRGGQINVSGGDVDLESGRIDASGFVAEAGGEINVEARNLNVGANALLITDGVDGGSMKLEGSESATLAGRLSSRSYIGNGGSIDLSSEGMVEVESTARVDVSGMEGGSARFGGGFQGRDAGIANATDLVVETGALVVADGLAGDGGEVIFWSDQDTMFSGEVSAQALGASGNGGFVEVSGQRNLSFDGAVSTLANNGQNGTLLLDPTDVIIGGASADITIAALNTAILGGNVVIHTSGTGGNGDITVAEDFSYTSQNSLTFLAHQHIFVQNDVQNADTSGTGHINMLAGWDGTNAPGTAPMDQVGGNLGYAEIGSSSIVSASGTAGAELFGEFGANTGLIQIQAIQGAGNLTKEAISVGSAHGETNLLAQAVLIYDGGEDGGSTGQRGNSAQVGYRRADHNPTGEINVMARTSILMDADSLQNSDGQFAHVMIGHGGTDNQTTWGGTGLAQFGQDKHSRDGNLSGDIKVVAEAGVLSMRSGEDHSFVQIGHGGRQIEGTKDGNVTIQAAALQMYANDHADTGRDINSSSVQIGHGGRDSRGAASGDISVVSASSIVMTSQDNRASNDSYSFTRIGHGGINAGAVLGTNSAENLDTFGGDASDNYSSTTGPGHKGAILVEARNGDITMLSGYENHAPSQIGHGGYRSHGNHDSTMLSTGSQQIGELKNGITVSATGDLLLDQTVDPEGRVSENIASASFTQIGLGGWQTGGRFHGDIDIDVGGNLSMNGGNGNQAYTQIGNGGYTDTNGNRTAYGDLTGDVDIDVAGDLTMRSGYNADDAYSHIGHGGTNRRSDLDGGHNGALTVDVGGNIDMATSAFDRVGSLTNDIVGLRNYTHIGFGGHGANGSHYGDISVNGGGYLRIETFSGFREFAANNNRYNGTATGADNYGQIGHGGRDAKETRGSELGIGVLGSSDVSIQVGGNVELLAANRQGVVRADITDQVDSDFDAQAGAGFVFSPIQWSRNNYVQLGHGGRDDNNGGVNRQIIGDVSVISGGDVVIKAEKSVPIDSTNPIVDLLKFGPDGVAGTGDDIHTNNNHTERMLNELAPADSYARIGLGGNFYKASTVGDILVAAAGDVLMEGGMGKHTSTVIGTGGRDSANSDTDGSLTTRTGDITVLSGGSITAIGNNNTAGGSWGSEYSHTQIGHDGERDAFNVVGDITVAAAQDVTLQAGAHDRDALVQIGHGGNNNNRGDKEGDIEVSAGGTVSVIGDGATAIVGSNAGNISPSVNRGTYAKIGHGSRNQASQTLNGRSGNINGGTWSGDIRVNAGVDVVLADGFIGHLDSDSIETNVTVTSGDTIVSASRLNPDHLASGAGRIVTDADSGFSSAGQGFTGQLRLYMPNRVNNGIDPDTKLNGVVYTATPTNGQAELLVDQRGDENLDYFGPVRLDQAFNYSGGGVEVRNAGSTTSSGVLVDVSFNTEDSDSSSVATDPYALANGLGGFYQIYYNNLTTDPDPVDPGTQPPTDTGSGSNAVAPLEPFVYEPFVGESQWETYEWPFGLLAFDGYDSFLGGLGVGDAVDSAENYVPRSGLEEALDAAFGRRRWTWRPGGEDYVLSTEGSDLSGSDYSAEQSEDRDRIRDRAMRGVGKGEMNFYLYDPSTSRYSSLRLFGYPTADVPAFEVGQ